MDARISARRAEVRAARRRARLRRTLLALLGVAVLAGAVAVERSALLAVDRIDVVGLERLGRAEVVAVAGVALGDPILRVRTGRAAEAVAALPLVRDARVDRTGLTRVRIAVEERRPVLVVEGRGRAVLLDRDGVAVAPGVEAGLPVVELVTAPPDVGRGPIDAAALANAYRAGVGLSGPLRGRVVRLVAPSPEGLDLVLDTGVRVRFGRAEDLAEKVRALGAVLGDTAGSGVTVIDVRVPAVPTVRTD
ncbi:MAG: cell division protein FtsQ/DivIB [Nitriliruptoraceae bacterium]